MLSVWSTDRGYLSQYLSELHVFEHFDSGKTSVEAMYLPEFNMCQLLDN